MRKLKISGVITTDPFDILSEQQRFYHGLYTSINKNVDATAKIESFLRDLNILIILHLNEEWGKGIRSLHIYSL